MAKAIFEIESRRLEKEEIKENIFKSFLERKIGQTISDEEFRQINKMVADDIKFNFVDFGKRVSARDVIIVAERCAIAFKRCC
ncbi:hypothetical protein [Clostridium sp. 001]|uniref:hypothetical protein n=1 Tax=Clostridium sp. 001 TaxID=1970093 RepID=UPI001C2C5308|nr:hypothetical protein [Clostridium sp. 001]QXE20427.1 hypothetical protein B5S50_17155 [Clostridium sp. 001]